MRTRKPPNEGSQQDINFIWENGERAGTRTLDRRIKSPLLYQLSYTLGKMYNHLPLNRDRRVGTTTARNSNGADRI